MSLYRIVHHGAYSNTVDRNAVEDVEGSVGCDGRVDVGIDSPGRGYRAAAICGKESSGLENTGCLAVRSVPILSRRYLEGTR